jgi:hypothetical protein
VTSFTYLGIEVADSGKVLKMRRANAWVAANRLNKLFMSDASPQAQLKTRIFHATVLVEQVFLYGIEALTLTNLYNYDALLHFALCVHHPTHMTSKELTDVTMI